MTMVLSPLQQTYQLENKQRSKDNIPHKIMNYYDSIYNVLFSMNEQPTIPRYRSKMMVNKRTQDMLIDHGLVYEIDEDQYHKLLNSRRKTKFNGPCYLISAKGHLYLKRFEHLRELFE